MWCKKGEYARERERERERQSKDIGQACHPDDEWELSMFHTHSIRRTTFVTSRKTAGSVPLKVGETTRLVWPEMLETLRSSSTLFMRWSEMTSTAPFRRSASNLYPCKTFSHQYIKWITQRGIVRYVCCMTYSVHKQRDRGISTQEVIQISKTWCKLDTIKCR